VTLTTVEQPVADLDRLRRALAYIDADPRAWNQTVWRQCVAGIVVRDEGSETVGDFLQLDGALVSISDAAQRLLGASQTWSGICCSLAATPARRCSRSPS